MRKCLRVLAVIGFLAATGVAQANIAPPPDWKRPKPPTTTSQPNDPVVPVPVPSPKSTGLFIGIGASAALLVGGLWIARRK